MIFLKIHQRIENLSGRGKKMSNYDHVIYKNDPVLFKSYVNKRCAVTATDRSVHTGIVYTVDPVTESIVLIEDYNSDEQRLKFVIGHAVQQVDVLSNDAEDLPQLFQRSSLQISDNFAAERKKAVMNLLLENRIPVTENDDILQIEDIVSIKPPYAPENCISTNTIVLTRIHNILAQLT